MQVSGPRDETQEERDDRNLIELLQELRVAGLGVQVLFGFLLALPFSSRFVQLGHWQRALYVGILVVSAARQRCCSGRWPITVWCSAVGRKSTWSGRPT